MAGVSELSVEERAGIIDCANVFLLSTDANGCIVEFNKHATDITGFEKQEVIGRPYATIIPNEHQLKVAQIFAAALEGFEAANQLVDVQTKNGRPRHLLLSAAMRPDGSGQPAGVVAVAHDVTDMQWPNGGHDVEDGRGGHSLMKTSSHEGGAEGIDDLKRIIETANTPFFFADTNGKVTEWNQMAARISATSKEEAVGRDLIDNFVPVKYREEFRIIFKRVMQGYEQEMLEFPFETKNQDGRLLLISLTARRKSNGEVVGVIGVGQDITDLRKANQQQQCLADDLQRLIDTANAPIFGVDVTGRVTEWNRMAAHLSGFSKNETMGKLLVDEFINVEFRPQVDEVIKRACNGEETANFEFPMVTKSGKRIEVLLNATTRRDADGIVTGMVGVGQDITNLRRAMSNSAEVADDLTRLIDTANAPIFGIDTDGRVTEWNRMAAEISQWSKEDTLGKSLISNFIAESYREEVGKVLQRALEGNETANYEFPLFTRQGARRDLLLNATTRRGGSGEIKGVIGVGQDITELRNATREQQRVADDLQRLIDTANAPIFGVDSAGRVTEWNRMAAILSGFSKEETMGKNLVEEFITAEYRMQVSGVLARACTGKETANFEFPLVTKTGKRIEVLLNATSRRDASGNVIGMVGVGQDITNLRRALSESKRVADDLVRVIDTANAPIFGIDVHGNVTEWNQKATALSGYTKGETLGRPLVEEFISEKYREEVGQVLNMALDGKDTANFEFPLFTKDGLRREILLNATTRRGATGEITGVIGVGQDITDLRKVTAEHQHVADDLQRLIDGANAPILGVNVAGHVNEWNRMAARLLGYTKDETMGKSLVNEFITAEYREQVDAVLARACQGEETANFEISLVTKTGKRIEVLLNATPRRDAHGEVIGMVGVGQDITNLRRAMVKATQIADDLTRVIDTANAPIFGIDTAGCVTEWNKMAASISGWSKEETIGKSLVNNFITANYRAEVGSVLSMALNGKETANYEFPLFTKDGQRREILLNATTRRGANGAVTGVIGVGQDITELRKVSAEQAMVVDDLRRLIETANAPIFGVDVCGRVTEWNRMAASLSGYSKDETMGRSLVDDFITAEYRIQVGNVLARACKGEETANFEFPLVTKTGKRIEVLLNATTRRDAHGCVTGMVGVGQDITDLRAAMIQSARVADDLTRVIDTANAPIFGIDPMGKVTEWNQMATALTGWDKDETVGKDMVQTFITEQYKEQVAKILTSALHGNETSNYEFPLFTKDGRRREILLNATTRRGADGTITGVIGVGQDITELRKVTAEQAAVADDLQRLIETANAPIFGVNVDGRVTEWNRMAAQLSGYPKSETMGKVLVEEFITAEYRKDVAAVLERANLGEETQNFEFPLMTRSGQRVEVLLNATPRRDAHGCVIGMVGVGQDITNLRQAMIKAQQVADDLTRVIDTANAPIFGVDTKLLVTEWNRMAVRICGWTKEETLGRSLVKNFITESYRQEVGRVLQSALDGVETANYVFPLYTKDGRRRDILLNATKRCGGDGVVTGVIGVGQDITELRKVTAEQKKVADDLQRLIDTANAPIFGVDTEGRVTEWNRMAAKLTGYLKEETVGKFLVHEFITIEYRESVASIIAQAVNGEETANFELPLVTKFGTRIVVLLNATTCRDADGDVTGVMGVGQDITELRAAMNESTRVADDLSRVVDTANAPIFGIDTQGHVTEWNQMATALSGWSKEDTLGHPLVDEFIAVNYRDDVGRILRDALLGIEAANYEFPLFTKDGERREILLNATTRRGPRGEIIGVIGVGQDITELRKVTAEQQRVADDLQRLIETANAPIFGVDSEGRVTEWNRMAAQLSGFTKEETIGKNLVQTFISDKYRKDVSLVLWKALGGEETANFEFPLVTKTGARVEVLLNATPRRAADGSVIGVVGVGQDITNLRAAALNAERVADDLTRVIETANAPIFGVDRAGNVTEWNNMAARISGWAKEETMGKPLVQQFIRQHYREQVARVLSLAFEGCEMANFEFPLFTKDGRRREILLNATTRRGSDGEVTGVIGVGQDITELREVMAFQQYVADDLKRLIESANAPIFGVNEEGRVTEWNRMAVTLSGYSKDETMGRILVDEFITPDYRSEVSCVLQKALNGEETANFEFPLVTKTSNRIEVLLNATPRRDASGKVIGMVGVGQDITNLRHEMLRSAQVADDLTRVIETANAPIFGIDNCGCVTEWNGMAARISGYTKEESMSKPLVETFISPNYQAEVRSVLSRALEGIDTANFEFPMFSKDGMRREILLNATTRRGANGQITGVIGVGQDITELRKVMAQQQHVADDLQRFIETANAPIFGVDTEGLITEWNRMAAQLSGFAKKEVLGRQLVKEFVADESKERVQQVLQQALEGKETANFEFPMVAKQGKRVDLMLNATTRRDACGEVIGVVGVGQDISALSRAFVQAQAVADDLTRLIDTANAPIFGIDPDGCVTEWNRKAAEISGWDKQETYGKLLLVNFVPEGERSGVERVLSQALENGVDSSNYEFPLCTRDGQRREILLNATARRSAAGNIMGVIGVGQDITELNVQRRNAERIADDLSRLIDTANAPIFGVDKQSRVTVWNQKVAELSNFSYEAVIGQPLVQNFISEEYRNGVAFVLLRALGGETMPNFEIALFSPDGERREVLMNAMPRCGPDGCVIGVICVGHDITEIRRVTAEQKREAEDMARLIRCANVPFIGMDKDGLCMEWNDKVTQMSGYTKDEAVGRPLVDLVVGEKCKKVIRDLMKVISSGKEQDLGEFDANLKTKDGQQLVLTMAGGPFRDAKGGIAGMVACGQDLTKMRETMVERSRVAEDLTRLIDTANAPIFGIDTLGRVMEWNRKTEEISGYSKEVALGKPLVETFIKKEYREDIGRVLKNALEGKETVNYEFPLFTKDGKRREILLNATTRQGQSGEVTGVIGVGQDITELRAVMVEQQRIAEDLSRFIETANAPIFGVDVRGRVTEWNRKAVELSGFSKQETMGRHLVDEFIMQDYRVKVQLVIQRALEGEETGNFELPLITKDGAQIEILLNATPRKDGQGKVVGMVGVGQEITLLRKSMRKSEWVADDLTRLIDTANAPIFGINVRGAVTEWNRKAAAISGYSKEEALGKPLVAHFISEAYRAEVQEVLRLALEGQESSNFEFPLFPKDGVMRRLLLNATTRRGADGRITGVIGVGQDITELRAVMQQSQRVADDLSRLIETANAPIFGLDVTGCVNEWNRKVAIISGFPREEVLGHPFVTEFIDLEHRDCVKEALDKALGGEVVGNFELLLYSRGGEKHDILLSATPRCGADGNVIGVVGVGQDITELNRQKGEAIRRAAELRHMIDTAMAPIVGVDRSGCVTEWNRRVIDVTGYTKEHVIGKDFLSFVLESCRAEAHRVLSDAFAGQSTPNFEVLVATTVKEPVTFLLSAAPHMSSAGNILGVICIGQDITHIKELEVKKSQFAATVTHELRSPLHGIIGLSDNLLAEIQEKGRMHRSMLMINNCARRLLDLVTNIMDLSSLVQSKRMKLSRDPVHIAKIIEEVIMLTTCAVDKAGHPVRKSLVQLFNKVPSDLPIIEADAHRCTQMLYNLITNALKFTERGQVVVSAWADDVKEFLTVAVSDTGIGIAPQKKDLIFRPFEQEDQTESRRFEGLGLGLSISREVARKHGGSLTVESEPGQGSTFYVSLPYRPFLKSDSQIEETGMNPAVEVPPWADNGGENDDDKEEEKEEIECMSMDSTVQREMAGYDKRSTDDYVRSHTSLPPMPKTSTQESLHPVTVPISGKDAEELNQLRFLTPSLQRQNAHLQLQVSQLRQRVTALDNQLNLVVQQQASLEDQAMEHTLQVMHMEVDTSLSRLQLMDEMPHDGCIPW